MIAARKADTENASGATARPVAPLIPGGGQTARPAASRSPLAAETRLHCVAAADATYSQGSICCDADSGGQIDGQLIQAMLFAVRSGTAAGIPDCVRPQMQQHGVKHLRAGLVLARTAQTFLIGQSPGRFEP
ncbi:MAG: hypothetical protein CL946_03980 [Ectothiorhodospiraceae bacterium]|nr:hypothetical protein [Ectothiorhodospiraceae bacterium]